MAEKVAEKPKKERLIGLDIIRFLAIIFVFMTHSMAYKMNLETDLLSTKWIFEVIQRFITLSCVPLFILLTGFLNNKDKPDAKYYKSIIPLVLSYVLISVVELVGTKLFVFENGTIKYVAEGLANINLPLEITKIFNFTQNSYAWYFEMYIGLFLLIPFLNIMWNNLKTNKEKVILVVSCCFLSLLPKTLESFRIPALMDTEIGGWLDVLPDFWKITHPLAYFFIGKLIRDLKPNYNYLIRILTVIVAVAIPVLCCYFTTKSTGEYAWYMFNGFGTITNAFVASSIFILFYDIKFKIPAVSQIISQISICSFEMYLLSSIFDKIYYNTLTELMWLQIVLLVVVSTYICARIWITVRDLIFGRIWKSPI